MRKAFVWCALLVAMCSLVPAMAQDCEALVVDETGLIGGQATAVQKAAQELVNDGADVRVWLIKSFGRAGNLDIYKEDAQRRCRSWQAPDGDLKNNMIVVMVSVGDKKAGIYGGSLWYEEFGSETDNIRMEEMGPRFREDDWAGGLAAALRRIHQLIANYKARSTGAPAVAQAPPVHSAPPAPPVVIQTEPTDFTGLWFVLFVALALGALIAGIMFFMRQAERRAKREKAQQRAKIAKQGCVSLSTATGSDFPVFVARVKSICSRASNEDGKPILEKLEQLTRDRGNAVIKFGQLETSAGDPDREGLDVGAYDAMAEAYEGASSDFTKVKSSMEAIDRDTKSLLTLIEQLPSEIEQATEFLTTAITEINAVGDQGYKVQAMRSMHESASQRLSGALSACTQKKFKEGRRFCQEAVDYARTATQAAKQLPATKADVDQKLDSALADLRELDERGLVLAGEAFERISEAYNEACWKPVRGNGTEAENRLDRAQETHAEAVKLASMDQQDWTKATELIGDVTRLIDEARSLLRSIHELDKHLAQAKADATSEISEARADIQKAEQFIVTHDDDVREELETQLADAQASLKEAESELSQQKPNYLEVVRIARKANESADRILAEARSEHEAAERLRERAARSIRSAERSVSACKEYLEDHSSDVGSIAASLGEVVSLLGRVRSGRTLEEQISLAAAAQQKADAVLKRAQVAVEEEESARRRRAAARRASHDSWGTRSSGSVFSGSGSSRGSFGSSGSFGSRGSFGSSGSIGGGRSFGKSGGW